MAEERIYIRGCGAISTIGTTQQEIAQACQSGIANPVHISLPHSCDHPLPYYSLSGELNTVSSPHLYQHIDNAVDSAIQDSGLTPDQISNLPVFVGSTACDISDLETQYQDDLQNDPHPRPLYRSGFGILADYVIERLQSNGQAFSFNTACSSSANALLMAARMIKSGRIDNALIMGVETQNQMSLQGFNAMMLLSPDECRPFDKHRNGTVLGEGIGAIILSRHKPTTSDYAAQNPYYYIGGANLTDSLNITSSSAEMIASVMLQALDDATLGSGDIGFVKAHGTSTPANDSAEAQGMHQVFGSKLPPFTSLKPYIGHTLGACGALETIILLACLKGNFIPTTPGFTSPDLSCDCQPLRSPQSFSSGNIMLNHFGFGGNNASLIISNLP